MVHSSLTHCGSCGTADNKTELTAVDLTSISLHIVVWQKIRGEYKSCSQSWKQSCFLESTAFWHSGEPLMALQIRRMLKMSMRESRSTNDHLVLWQPIYHTMMQPVLPPSAHDGMGESYSPQYIDADFAIWYYRTGRGPQRCAPPGTWCYSSSRQQHSWRSATKISLIFFIFRKKLFFHYWPDGSPCCSSWLHDC